MMEAFTAYIKTIAAFTVFAAFTEMLMPDGSFRRYIHMVMGILLLSAVLEPILKWVHIDQWSLPILAERKYFALSEQYGMPNEEEFRIQEQERFLEIYEQEWNQRLSEELTKQFGGTFRVKTELEKNVADENYGNISSVTVEGDFRREEEIKQYMEQTYLIAAENITVWE